MQLPLTVSSWLSVYRQGADPRLLLAECHRLAVEASPPAAWIHLATAAELEAQLQALDAMLAACPDRAALLERHPLFGVPYAVKDNIDIANVATTAACPAFSYTAKKSAGVVQRLQAAGAVWLGKSNLDQFATGLVGTRSPYGRPSSVFSAEHISGGSSSGSAIAVAAGRVAFSLGTDTAGSGRVPAGFNQIVGMKPTPGRVGASGVVPACRTLDCVSVYALTVGDSAHVLASMEGPDAADSYSAFVPGPASWRRSGGLRLGVPADIPLSGAGEYGAPWAQALEHARGLGHRIVPLDFTLLYRVAELLYAGPWVAERYCVAEKLMEAEPQALEPTVRVIIGAASRYSAADAFKGRYALSELAREAAALWQSADVLMVPTAPGHPRIAEVLADPYEINAMLGRYTNFVNLLGWCALALPAGTVKGAAAAAGTRGVGTPAALPFGVTFIAPGSHDTALLQFGREWEGSIDLPCGATGQRRADIEPAGPDSALRMPAVHKTLALAVVGAHLSGMPLNKQLLERGAVLREATRTSPRYRLHALPGTVPPKPGLVRVVSGAGAGDHDAGVVQQSTGAGTGHAIEVEVWDVPEDKVGSFLALVPPPLGLGSLELADGRWVHGFICEGHAVADAPDISRFGGWRAYMQSLSSPGPDGRRPS